MLLLAIIIVAAILLFYLILQFDIPGTWKFGLIFIEMLAVSQIMIRRYKLPSELGLVLIKSDKGIGIIESAAKYAKTFSFLSDVGNTIAYGVLSMAITRKNISVTSFILGLFILGFLAFLVAPTAFVVLFSMLDGGGTESAGNSIAGSAGEYGLWIVLGILVVGGLFLFMLSGIIFYGSVVLGALVSTLVEGTNAISQVSPGGTLLLPGVNLPLFEGILALTIVMVVHEGAHAILARVGKIPVVSSGIVLFGIIPVGAFVEPDEDKLAKADNVKQTRVLVAGSTSNLISSCIFFVLFLGLALFMKMALLMDFAPLVFIRTTLGLTFALNFIVGVVNLLPLPLFDGYRIFDINVGNKHIVKALMYVTLAFFILNFLPWFFR